jgi:hypothetical protein
VINIPQKYEAKLIAAPGSFQLDNTVCFEVKVCVSNTCCAQCERHGEIDRVSAMGQTLRLMTSRQTFVGLNRSFAFSGMCRSVISPLFCKKGANSLFNIELCVPFLGAFAKFQKATIRFVTSVTQYVCLSVCLPVSSSVRMQQRGYHWTDFDDRSFFFFRKSVEKIQVSLNSDKTKVYFR